MRQLDARECYGRIAERFEAQHGSTAAFDRTMILLNEVVQVGTAPDEHILPLRILPAQAPQRLMTRDMPVERDLARPPRQAAGQCLAKEGLRRRNAPIGSEQKVDGLARQDEWIFRARRPQRFSNSGTTYRITHRRIVVWTPPIRARPSGRRGPDRSADT